MKAMHTLFCALGPNEYTKVSLCDNAKEIWDNLEATHERTSRVKESKISFLTLDYELFKAKLEEGIKEMSNCFTHIINGLKALGKTYPNKEMSSNMKLKVKAIEESKYLNSFFLDELIDSLLTYEMKINYNAKEIKEVQKKVGVTFKSTTCEKDGDFSNNDDDDEMTMFAKRFKRKDLIMNLLKRRTLSYECKKLGHIKFECPQWKKRGSSKQKLKAHVATWTDEDLSDNEDQELANLCLMAIDDIKVTSNSSTLNDYSFDELQDAYDELGLEFEVMKSKDMKNVSKLRNKNDLLSKPIMNLKRK
ncbi:zf-CCHC domain-containing protein/UBN2 domain-containing protein [Gossypium australe]|uniref:Zf-CCHC domain-containing protein/UBN2 domain-containing protein n=1 Tax=Gossypium australe TaxID=47621 RepID=A0A5B6W895_9ROSI|nr:zf-CCHC domain-containing protein/UBN2 domain-containing protein [Gossypium australe]